MMGQGTGNSHKINGDSVEVEAFGVMLNILDEISLSQIP